MTTREFMERNLNYQPSKETWCSSVMQDTTGNFYSYGYHYPLLFKVAGHWFVNTMGYSNTTAKHINWAWSAIDYNATAVELSRDDARVISSSWASDDEKLQAIKSALRRKLNDIKEVMLAKKRHDTQVYRLLEQDLIRVQNSWNEVTELA